MAAGPVDLLYPRWRHSAATRSRGGKDEKNKAATNVKQAEAGVHSLVGNNRIIAATFDEMSKNEANSPQPLPEPSAAPPTVPRPGKERTDSLKKSLQMRK